MEKVKTRKYYLDDDTLHTSLRYDEDSGLWFEDYVDFETIPRYTPNMVFLASGDFNRDGIDDLAIASGRLVFRSIVTQNEIDASTAVILWGATVDMLQSSVPVDLNEKTLGKLTRVSLTTGDLDGDGYKELIATGQP